MDGSPRVQVECTFQLNSAAETVETAAAMTKPTKTMTSKKELTIPSFLIFILTPPFKLCL
jgi:hypothetical protein